MRAYYPKLNENWGISVKIIKSVIDTLPMLL
jgi:hypothetical protein